MRCPHCQHENPSSMKFCGECGGRLELPCPACRQPNPPANKFCGHCGAPLIQAPDLARFGSPETYTPRHLAEKILGSKSAIEGERKQVTVLFADIKGSMELLADRDPEDSRKLLDAVIEEMMEAVHRYEGTVNHVLGDGIMALFGAPLAHEDHAVRACYAALRMQESVKRYAVEIQRTQGTPLQIRVGLNSGEVIVGTIRNDLHVDYTAIGQTAYLAARMEQTAMPGSILMTADTLSLAEGHVQVEAIGPVNVKGMRHPIEVYELTGVGPARSRLQAAAARGLTRFVGRSGELETLRQALDRAKTGHGQLVALVGQPGVGKSRLFWEFTRSRSAVGCLVLQSGSFSYGKTAAYLPIVDLLKAYFAIEDRDEVRKIREKITGKLLTLDRSLESALPALLALLDIRIDDTGWRTMDPGERRRRTLEAIKRLLLRESQVQPVVVVLEDLHWIDSESQYILDNLVESLPGARILLLVNYRPEYRHGWGNKSYYSQLRVDPLPAESASELLDIMLGTDADLERLKKILIERTEGNPFFIEESIRNLVDTAVLEGERGKYRIARTVESTQVPATVQAVLVARIDRLAPDEKRLLQSAAVVGKDVPFSLLEAIADSSEEELRRSLARLQAAEFLYETSLFPDLEYTFKHALTHEVAYGSVLHERRRSLHGRILKTMEQLYADRVNEHVERLAHHAVRAEAWSKAVEYLRQAGKKAAARSANREAIACFEQALETLKHLPESRRAIEAALDIRVELGPVLIAKSGFAGTDVEDNYTRARELCERLNEPPQLFAVLFGLARMHDVRGELKIGRELGNQLLALAERAQEPALLLEAHHELWANMSMLGELTAAREHCEQGFLLYDPDRHRDHAFLYGGHDPGVCSAYHAAQVLWLLGYPDQALGKSSDALALARRLSHALTITNALFFGAWLHQQRGEPEVMRAYVEEAVAIATEQGFPRWLPQGNFLREWFLFETRDRDRIAQMVAILASERAEVGSGRWDVQCAALLAEAYAKVGKPAAGLNVLLDALNRARQTACRYYEAELYRLAGELLLTQPAADEQQAERYFLNALRVARDQSARSLELRVATSMSRLWQRQGKKEEGRGLLSGIYGWFTEGFDTADLKAAKALLIELA